MTNAIDATLNLLAAACDAEREARRRYSVHLESRSKSRSKRAMRAWFDRGRKLERQLLAAERATTAQMIDAVKAGASEKHLESFFR